MNDKTLEEEEERKNELNNPLIPVIPPPFDSEGGNLEPIKTPGGAPVKTEEGKAKWEKEIDRLYRAYESHLDLGLKAVGFFYAILGGILSIYFSGNGRISRDVVIVLLGLPIIMSIILGGIFFYGASLWSTEVAFIREKTKDFDVTIWLKVELLSYALRIFGLLFFIVGGFLIWLIIRLLD